jgi:Na+/proline symporter
MAVVYWGLFAIEIVVLKKIFEIIFPDAQSYTGIVILSIALCIVYAAMGGYLGTMRTDAFQTIFLCIILIIFTIVTLPNDTLSILFSSRLFSKWPTASWEDIIPFLISACLLGCAYLIVQQDAWSRVSSASRREGIKTISLNLSLALLAVIPTAFLGLWGIYAYEKFSADVNALGNDSVPGLLIRHFKGNAPVGLLLPCFVAVAISTADTALMTCVQSISTIRESWTDSVKKCRLWLVLLGLGGLVAAYISPNAVDFIFGFGAIPIVLMPVIIGKVMGRGKKAWPILIMLIVGFAMAILIIVIGGEFRNIGPPILFVLSIILYPVLNFLPIGKSNQKESNGNT